MNRLRALRRQLFDIRPGEHLRTWFMFLYLISVLFAYYVLKPVSRSMFITKFDVDKLPALYILIAAFGNQDIECREFIDIEFRDKHRPGDRLQHVVCEED